MSAEPIAEVIFLDDWHPYRDASGRSCILNYPRPICVTVFDRELTIRFEILTTDQGTFHRAAVYHPSSPYGWARGAAAN